jgi:hypothetical protein
MRLLKKICGRSSMDTTDKKNASTLRKKPLSPEDHRKRLDKDVHTNRGKFRTIPRSVTNSQAFACLGRGGMIFVISMFDALVYEKGPRKKDRKRKVEAAMLDGGEFVVTNAELMARGLKSPTSIAKARKEAWDLGFFDVIQPATVLSCGKYKYSERWRSYPSGDYLPTDQSPPGLALHPQWKSASLAADQAPLTPFSVVKAEVIFPASENDGSTPENVVITTESGVEDPAKLPDSTGLSLGEGEKPDHLSPDPETQNPTPFFVVKPTPYSVVKEPGDGGDPLTTETVVKEGPLSTPENVVTYIITIPKVCDRSGTEDGTVQEQGTENENGSEQTDVRTDPDTDFRPVHVQEEDQNQENGTEEPNGVDPITSSPAPMISAEILEELPLTNKWFVPIFMIACNQHGIPDPDLNLSESSGTRLDQWIDRILRRRTLKGKRKWIAEQLSEIVQHWNETFLASRRSPVPTLEIIAEDMFHFIDWNAERKGSISFDVDGEEQA